MFGYPHCIIYVLGTEDELCGKKNTAEFLLSENPCSSPHRSNSASATSACSSCTDVGQRPAALDTSAEVRRHSPCTAAVD